MIYSNQLNKEIYKPKEVSDMIGVSLRNFQKHNTDIVILSSESKDEAVEELGD